jgi:hypothetical protein
MLKAKNKKTGVYHISYKDYHIILGDRENYECPVCNEDLIFVDGNLVIKHFRHKIESNCESEPETQDHIEMKKYIQEKLNLSDEEIEYTKLLHLGFKPDAFLEKQNIAIEVQHSNLTEEEFIRRTMNYTKNNIAVLWIFDRWSLLKEDVSAMLRRAHGIYYGRIYCYDIINKNILPIHLEPMYRWVKEYEGHGGYWAWYKKKRKVVEGLPIEKFSLLKTRNLWQNNNFIIAKFYDKIFWEDSKELPTHRPNPDSDWNCDCGNKKSPDYDVCYECYMEGLS